MGPAGRQDDVTSLRQSLEPGIAIDLQHPTEPVEMAYRALGPAVWAIEVDRRRRVRSAPWPVIAHIDPEPPCARPTAAGIENGQRRVIGEQLLRREHVIGEPRVQ